MIDHQTRISCDRPISQLNASNSKVLHLIRQKSNPKVPPSGKDKQSKTIDTYTIPYTHHRSRHKIKLEVPQTSVAAGTHDTPMRFSVDNKLENLASKVRSSLSPCTKVSLNTDNESLISVSLALIPTQPPAPEEDSKPRYYTDPSCIRIIKSTIIQDAKGVKAELLLEKPLPTTCKPADSEIGCRFQVSEYMS